MAPRMCVAMVVAAMLFTAAAAQSPPDCTAAIQTMLPCLPYVTGTGTVPGDPCCQSIVALNTNNPTCLCASVSQLDANRQVNRTRALSLAKECNVAIDAASCPALAAPPLPSLPPTLPPLPAVPPTMFTPPAGPVSAPRPSTPGTPPVASGPSAGPTPPPVSGSPSSNASSPGPSPPVSEASAIRSSLALCVAAVGMLALAL